ncbi:SOS response-associated peptidase family protein [uncultured Winogradskyella sp.]|uniref:SOS response-associated peptidase n=1 Tax=uncultured Winogradskyella sp. TaxID=395353 RepID=UPI002602391F|nr:SOS response-associated peptidase family protein [uncultured Winogradskyella sp.]
MFYKLSNAVEKNKIEKDLNLRFKYPNLYVPDLIINGLTEATISIVTMEDKDEINLAIWGLMPEDYKEDWSTFQEISNTLNLNLHQLQTVSWMKPALKHRRALILVSGFFAYLLRKGTVYTYYVSLPNDKSFFIGGIYNQLDDGFLSCSPITTKANKFISSFHNVDNQMPIIITDSVVETWMSEKTTESTIAQLIKNPPKPKLRANPIANDFFKNKIVYNSLLQPVYYDEIPKGGLSNS